MDDGPLADVSACSGERRRSSRIQASSSIGSNGPEPSIQTTPPTESSETAPVTKSARSSPRAGSHAMDHGPTTAQRTGLRRRNEASDFIAPDPISEAMRPLTDEERRNWAGWVELESDPALFNFILREYGVKDVKVQEVLGFDDSLLAMLPKPVYGLIFLFKYRDEEEEEGTEEAPECPKHVWFANQTITNACATVALLNIVMNIPEINLGDALSSFKAETRRLKPPYRGKKLGCDAFIRNIHNSFARRMDMLNADLALSNEMGKWNKAKNSKRKNTKNTKKNKEEEDPGYHFIAYVPINGVVWRLDGLRRQPGNLGEYREDWMAVALANINQHIYQSQQDGVQFSLLSLCKSPLRTDLEKLVENMHSIASVKELLTSIQPDWQQFTELDESILVKVPDSSFGISQELFDNSGLSEATRQRLREAGTDASALIDLYQEYVRDQIRLQTSYMDEAALIEQENEQARRRKHDYTPIIYNSIKKLAERGVLKRIIDEIRENEAMRQRGGEAMGYFASPC